MEPVRLESHPSSLLESATTGCGGRWTPQLRHLRKGSKANAPDLLFGAGANSKFYFANLPLPPKDDSVLPSLTSLLAQAIRTPIGNVIRQDSLFSNKAALSTEPLATVDDDDDDDYTLTDISEDDDDDDEFDDDLDDHPSNTHRMVEEDEWVLISSHETKGNQEDLLDSLQFTKMSLALSRKPSVPQLVKPRLLLLGLFINEGRQEPLETQGSKPILKRSLTTGIITIENANDRKQSQLRIIFARKHNSFTDISKKYPHFQNDLVRETIVDMEVKSDTQRGAILGKQRLIVGILDFSVTAMNHQNSGNGEPLRKYYGDECEIHFDTAAPCNLSSSLNKYLMLNLLLKNLILKLSLNLTKIYKLSRAKFHKLDSLMLLEVVSSTELAFLPPSLMTVPKPNAMVSPKLVSPHSCSSAILAVPAPSLVMSAAPARDGGYQSSYSMPMLPNTTRKLMLSTELLALLKECIKIDYRLGKVPLPPKVVDANDDDLDMKFDDGVDDYHLKGW